MFIKRKNKILRKKQIIAIGCCFMAIASFSSFPLVLTSCKTQQNSADSNQIININSTNLPIDSQAYAHDNSMSLLSVFKRKSDVNSYFSAYNNLLDPAVKTYISTLSTQSSDDIQTKMGLGTSWMFDYSETNDVNLFNYYLATNMHVLNWTNDFDISDNANNISYKLVVPVNDLFNEKLEVYLSQPPNDKNQKLFVNYENVLNNRDWYKTNIDLSNYESNILNIGAFSNDGNDLQTKNSQKFDFYIEKYRKNPNDQTQTLEEINYYYKENNEPKVTKSLPTTSNKAKDFSILKIQADPNDVSLSTSTLDDDKVPVLSSDNRDKINQNLKNIFSVTNTNISNTSSYITRLRQLIQLARNGKVNTDEFANLFLFDTLLNVKNKNFTIGGFSGELSDDKTQYSAIFNAATLPTNQINKISGLNKNEIGFLNNGKISFNSYDANDNYILSDNTFLKPGASGSMGLVSNRISAIYWGYVSGENDRGVVTPIYDNNFNNNSLVKTYLNYIKTSDPNSQLYKLFSLLVKI